MLPCCTKGAPGKVTVSHCHKPPASNSVETHSVEDRIQDSIVRAGCALPRYTRVTHGRNPHISRTRYNSCGPLPKPCQNLAGLIASYKRANTVHRPHNTHPISQVSPPLQQCQSRFFSWQYARMAVAPLAGAATFAASQTASDFACEASEHAKASLSRCPPRLSELSRIIPLCTPGEPSGHLRTGIIPSAFARAARARRFPCARTRRERPDDGRSHDRMVFRAN